MPKYAAFSNEEVLSGLAAKLNPTSTPSSENVTDHQKIITLAARHFFVPACKVSHASVDQQIDDAILQYTTSNELPEWVRKAHICLCFIV